MQSVDADFSDIGVVAKCRCRFPLFLVIDRLEGFIFRLFLATSWKEIIFVMEIPMYSFTTQRRMKPFKSTENQKKGDITLPPTHRRIFVCMVAIWILLCAAKETTYSVSQCAAKETTCSLPQHIVLRLKRSILADIQRTHGVTFTIMRHKHSGEDMMLVAVEGVAANRLSACGILEDVITKIKSGFQLHTDASRRSGAVSLQGDGLGLRESEFKIALNNSDVDPTKLTRSKQENKALMKGKAAAKKKTR
eukprot:220238_1